MRLLGMTSHAYYYSHAPPQHVMTAEYESRTWYAQLKLQQQHLKVRLDIYVF